MVAAIIQLDLNDPGKSRKPRFRTSASLLILSAASVKNASAIAAKKLMSYYSDYPGHIISNIPGLLPSPYYWYACHLGPRATSANWRKGGKLVECLEL